MVSDFLSQKFRFWSFVSMVLLVFVHGYNLQDRYLQPWTVPSDSLTITSFTEYFFANGIFRFRIPMLFAISGYLYALYDYKPQRERIKKRLQTLLLPYLIWSATGLALSFLLELMPYTKSLIINSHVLQIDETRMLIHDYHWYELLARWLFFPVSYQLWFIRVLLIYNIAYMAIRWCVTHSRAKWIFFSIATLLWLATFGTPILEGEGLLFFSLGVWIQKNKINFEQVKGSALSIICVIIFISASWIKTWLAFRGMPILGNSLYPVLTVLHKIVVVTGLVSAWLWSNQLVRVLMERKWFVWLSAFSFMIYALHAPLVAFAIDGMFQWLKYFQFYRIATFILLPVTIIGACITIGAAIRKLYPTFYSVLTGGRGF